MLEQLPQ